MNITPFKLERYFAKYEFSAKYLLSSSDCDGLAVKDLLNMADSECKKLWDDLKLGYTESLGFPLLREEVSKLYQGISKDEVLLFVPEEGIFVAMNCILESGDHMITTFPGYQSLYQLAELLGCEVTKWLPQEEKGWEFDLDILEKSIKPNSKLLVVNFPHNPTGFLPTKEYFLKIVEIAKKHNLFLFSDEMYRFLELNVADRLPSACEVYEKAVSLFGMSKTFGMAGARLGWLVTKDKDLYTRMANFKDYVTICGSAPSEILSLIALRAKDRIIENHLTRIKKNLGLISTFFDKYSKLFSWVKPIAGTIALPKINMDIDAYTFAENTEKESGIMILPSNVYDFDNKHFRIGYGRENMPEALEKFDNYLQTKKF